MSWHPGTQYIQRWYVFSDPYMWAFCIEKVLLFLL